MPSSSLRGLLALLGCALTLTACGSDDTSSAPSPVPYTPPPSSIVVDDPGPLKIRKEVFEIDGFTPPPNPDGNIATPVEYNRVRVVRYRVDATPPKPARAIVVMMPGFIAGAGPFDGLARAIVRRSGPDDALEAWAVDRRSNLLEDTHGLDVAEARRDPSRAQAYYFQQEEVEGKTFEGFRLPASMKWMSEWGAETTVEDLRRVIELVPQQERKTRVVLLGHSLGASIAEAYAAWDFGDAGRGYEHVAGIVLADGVTGDEGDAVSPIEQEKYENGDPENPGGFGPSPGVVADIRAKGNTVISLPLLGQKAYVVAEYIAMAARWSPNAVEDDTQRDNLLKLTLGLTALPKMTNRAAFGFGFDAAYNPLVFTSAACGAATGGAIESYDSLFGGQLEHPSDPNATYDWQDYDEVTPVENTAIDDFARSFYEGPGVNLAEWYFPQRLPLDLSATSTLNIAEDDWRATEYGLRAMHGADIDAPVLAVAFALVGDASAYDKFRAMLPPVGEGRLHAGATRDTDAGFRAMAWPALQHVDGLVAADVPGSLAAAWYDEVVAFTRSNTPAGGVVVDAP